jgi:hypothetical protein
LEVPGGVHAKKTADMVTVTPVVERRPEKPQKRDKDPVVVPCDVPKQPKE